MVYKKCPSIAFKILSKLMIVFSFTCMFFDLTVLPHVPLKNCIVETCDTLFIGVIHPGYLRVMA